MDQNNIYSYSSLSSSSSSTSSSPVPIMEQNNIYSDSTSSPSPASTSESDSNLEVYTPKSLLACALNRVPENFDESSIPKSITDKIVEFQKMIRLVCPSCLSYYILCQVDSLVDIVDKLRDLIKDDDYFCVTCVTELKRNRDLYIERMPGLLSKDGYWDAYVTNIMKCQPEDIGDWDWKNLTLEQALLIKNHPNRIPNFCDETVRVICATYTAGFGNISIKFCSMCVGKSLDLNCSIPYLMRTTSCSKISAEDFVNNYMHDESMWCSSCLYTPLFDLFRSGGSYFNVDIVHLKQIALKEHQFDCLYNKRPKFD